MRAQSSFTREVAVIGGAGHVGLPLALSFADRGLRTLIYDVNRASVETIRSGRMPFAEEGAQEILGRVLHRTLEVEDAPQGIATCKYLVMIIGTPVDEHLNPTFNSIHRAIEQCSPFLRNGQVLVLRSTVFPGITEHIRRLLHDKGIPVEVAFCPERVAQGHSLREFRDLPQIVSAFNPDVLAEVKALFGDIEYVEMTPLEAELCKLMTNAWRYLQFAAVNQFYMIATQHGLDFRRILHGCRFKYPRMAGMPGPGFAAGPCLVKDTMQLAAFSANNFVLGHAAMLINEGLPAHVVQLAKREVSLSDETVGILGMAFKAESDDPRDSLSYKLRKLLTLEAKRVLCTDPFVRDPSFVPLDVVLTEARVLVVGTPHAAYKKLILPASTKLIDAWDHVQRMTAQ
ncbi:MAG TPA: nucleotide sugar dehydrogenase [Polyangiaceae bacterium]|nr:nucleotide sugar dehydrogenase [Polyangiaceae bacterium]